MRRIFYGASGAGLQARHNGYCRMVKRLMDIIASRTSCRAYKPDPVSEADILLVLEAARLAPSACNKQPWRFAVVRDPQARRRIVEKGFLPGIKMHWALDALFTWAAPTCWN